MITSGYIAVEGGQMHYRSSGEGRVVVLLPPAPRSSRYFAPIMALLGSRRVVAVDPPGLGLSTALPSEWTMASIASKIAETIESAGWPTVDVIGVHTGNKVGSALAATRPDLVRSLSIVGMSHSLVLDDAERNAAFAAYSPSPESVRDAVPGAGAERWKLALADASQACARGIEALQSGKRPSIMGVVDYVEDVLDAADCYEPLYRANYGFDFRECLARIAAPTLVLELLTTQEADLGEHAGDLVALLSIGRAQTIAASDRRLMTYEPDRLAAALTSFLDIQSDKTGTARG